MMKKFMALALLVVIFLACDYAKESLELKPDIEVTWINPVAWVTFPGDTIDAAMIEEIHFVARNSIDSYLKEFTLEYYHDDTVLFFGPSDPIAIYGKIEGIVNPAIVDTFVLLGVPVPLGPARDYLGPNEAARVLLRFVAFDELFEETDTTDVWFGIWMLPTQPE
jgi:hypothetical protein